MVMKAANPTPAQVKIKLDAFISRFILPRETFSSYEKAPNGWDDRAAHKELKNSYEIRLRGSGQSHC